MPSPNRRTLTASCLTAAVLLLVSACVRVPPSFEDAERAFDEPSGALSVDTIGPALIAVNIAQGQVGSAATVGQFDAHGGMIEAFDPLELALGLAGGAEVLSCTTDDRMGSTGRNELIDCWNEGDHCGDPVPARRTVDCPHGAATYGAAAMVYRRLDGEVARINTKFGGWCGEGGCIAGRLDLRTSGRRVPATQAIEPFLLTANMSECLTRDCLCPDGELEEVDCDDGDDDDCDGRRDCADPDCVGHRACECEVRAETEDRCGDGMDDDCDGDVDCEDDDCADLGCGTGFVCEGRKCVERLPPPSPRWAVRSRLEESGEVIDWLVFVEHDGDEHALAVTASRRVANGTAVQVHGMLDGLPATFECTVNEGARSGECTGPGEPFDWNLP